MAGAGHGPRRGDHGGPLEVEAVLLEDKVLQSGGDRGEVGIEVGRGEVQEEHPRGGVVALVQHQEAEEGARGHPAGTAEGSGEGARGSR